MTTEDDDDVRRLLERVGREAEEYEQNAENDKARLRVEIVQRDGKPATCKVWRSGVLVFDGVDRSAAARFISPCGGMVEPGCACGGMAACPQCQDRDARAKAEEDAARLNLVAAIRTAVVAWNNVGPRKPGEDVSEFIADWLIENRVNPPAAQREDGAS